jgi:hypothetical protein
MELVLKLAFLLLRSNSHYIRRHLVKNFGTQVSASLADNTTSICRLYTSCIPAGTLSKKFDD